jgi:hypothetical protein
MPSGPIALHSSSRSALERLSKFAHLTPAKVVTEVAANSAARHRRRRDMKVQTFVSPRWQKRLLDFGGDPQVIFQPCPFKSGA